ncbi:NAD(P)H-hydrate dehydratase [Galactobacter sp.]|uniref:NAD(P)H-hydrate dehydratase n=1 Tax=Galactobacter sp. TaxID=2676125 RepID=UPI0025C69CC4|nr:NAD(P)H-hydrate dehydratase [Galactobacter sp.]
MRPVWQGSKVREAERGAVAAATAEGDPDRHMRLAAHALATAVLRHLTTGDTRPSVSAAADECTEGGRPGAGIGVAGTRIVIVVGPGGNGGDGLYAGAKLSARGAAVAAVPVTDHVQERALAAFLAAGGRVWKPGTAQARDGLGRADVVVDAGFGTGARGGLPADIGSHWPKDAWVVAADAPSGVDTDSGHLVGDGFTPAADLTVTFGALKTGLFLREGRALAGAVTEVPIPGLLDPDVLGEPAFSVLSDEDAFDRILSPRVSDHKYSRGVLGLLAGSPSYPGAAILAGQAALATGLGMLTAFPRERACTALTTAIPEAVVVDRETVVNAVTDSAQAAKVSAWLLGPGLGDDQADLEPAAVLLGESLGERSHPRMSCPKVVDASALAVVPAASGSVSDRSWVLTPHAGELKALNHRLRLGLLDPVEHPLEAVRGAATALNCVVLLKGSTTLVATARGEVFAACSAGPELAVAGAGDTLAGILGAMVATHAARAAGNGASLSHEELARLAAAAAVLHGRAAAQQKRCGIKGSGGLSTAIARIMQQRESQ